MHKPDVLELTWFLPQGGLGLCCSGVLRGDAGRRHFFFNIHSRAMKLEVLIELFMLISNI